MIMVIVHISPTFPLSQGAIEEKTKYGRNKNVVIMITATAKNDHQKEEEDEEKGRQIKYQQTE